MTRFAGEFAGDVNIGSFMSDTADFGQVGQMTVMEDAENDASQAMRNAYIADAGMRAKAKVASADAMAPAIVAGGAGRGMAALGAGVEGIGSVLGKGIRSGFGGGSSSPSGGYGFGYFDSRGAFR